ncbi:MAG: NAD(P)-dependent oxidoreductase, partial [Proteobacteria bacterium]|nr:NAD(P)-dependent oxidoreductase [Pseudomonadota bacterium]
MYDISADAVPSRSRAKGATAAASPRAVGDAADVVFLSLPN